MKNIVLAISLALVIPSAAMAVTDVYQTSPKKTYYDRYYADQPSVAPDSCNAEDFEWMIGRGSSPLHYLSNDPSRVRIVIPGRSYTMEYVPDRLNFHISQKGRVERVSCG